MSLDSSLAPVAAALAPMAAASSNPLPVTVRLAAYAPEGMWGYMKRTAPGMGSSNQMVFNVPQIASC